APGVHGGDGGDRPGATPTARPASRGSRRGGGHVEPDARTRRHAVRLDRGRSAAGAGGGRGGRPVLRARAPLADGPGSPRPPGSGDRLGPLAPVIARPRASVTSKQGSPVGPG